LIAAGLVLAEVIVFALSPQPGAVGEWFELLQRNRLIGLLGLWVLEVPLYLMYALVFLALFVALRPAGRSAITVSLAFAFLGIGVFLATNNPFSMLSLSDQQAVATSEAERSALLAAGQAALANTGQRAVGGFNTGLFLVSIAGLAASGSCSEGVGSAARRPGSGSPRMRYRSPTTCGRR
jgi:hypothetical protein